MRNINTEQFKKMLQEDFDGVEIVDVREKHEWDALHFRGSKLIPVFGVSNRLDEIDWDKTVVFVCRSGARSGYAAGMIDGKYDVLNLAGGISACARDEDFQTFLEQ